MIRRLLAALLVCLGTLPPAAAERPALADPVFETVSAQGSIIDDVVSALVVDRRGMLWIGTADGLVRFDGHEFQAQDWAGELAAGTAFVRSLLAARDGRIWVGFDRHGLASFDPQTLSWRFFRPGEGLARGTVRVLEEDAEGRLWAGIFGVGLQRIDPKSGRIERWGLEQGLPDLRVQALLIDTDGSLWAGTWNGLARLAPGAKRFEPVALGPAAPAGLAGAAVSALHRDGQGRLWVGTARGELLRLGPGDRGLEWLDRGDSRHGAAQAFVDMDDGEIWVGRAAGLEIRRLGDGSLQRRLQQRLSQPWGLASSDVRSMVRDRSGLLWLGSYGGGLQRHHPGAQAIWVRHADPDEQAVLGVADVRSLAEVELGGRREIWAGTNARGLAVLDSDLRLLAEIRPQPAGAGGYSGGRAGGMTVRRKGDSPELWVGTDAGVAVFDAARRRWLVNHQLGQGRVRMLLATRDGGMVLAATQDGLYRWTPAQPRFERLALADGSALVGDVNALAEQADGLIWVGGERGLFQLAAGAGALAVVAAPEGGALHDANVLGLHVDAQQTLWVDTTSGLHRRRTDGGFDWVSEKLGQGGKSFGANLRSDAGGRIWTHRGVYDPAKGSFHEIGPADGVDIGTGWFRSHTALSDGRLLFGGSKGLLVIDPARFRPWSYAPPLQITELRVNGQVQPPSRAQPRLVLQPEDQSFALRFAALDLSQPARNRYRYRLEGLDADWIDAKSGDRLASYGGLAPGRYTLVLDGTNRAGRWSEQPLRIEVEVLPAWWQTWWARALAALLVLAAAAGWTQWRTRRLRERRQDLEARVQARTQELAQLSERLSEQGRELAESALSDPLTGLRNRRFIAERIEQDLELSLRRHEEAQRRGLPPPDDADLCCFLIDIDHFKEVNDLHGHAAGDAVLLQMRERLLEVFRASDYLVRWGGEEFLVVARGGSRRNAAQLAERARLAVGQRPFELPGGQQMSRNCSIGFACFPLSRRHLRAVPWSSVLALADTALYAAKRAGRNRWDGVLDGDALDEAALGGRLGDGGRLDPRLHRLRGP